MAAEPQPPRREATPSTSGESLTGQWEQLRPQLRSWWDRLTEADLMAIDGQKDRLISIVQQRYGYPREHAQQEVEGRLQEYGGRMTGITAAVSSAAQEVASSVTETVRAAATKTQEMAGAATTPVTDMAAGVGTYVQEKGLQGLSEDLTQLIRRYPVPALLVGLGIGFILARTVGTRQTAPGS